MRVAIPDLPPYMPCQDSEVGLPRDGEASAKPLERAAPKRLMARPEPRPPMTSNPKSSFDKAPDVQLGDGPRLEARYGLGQIAPASQRLMPGAGNVEFLA